MDLELLQRTLGAQVEIESVFESEACPAIVDPNQLATAILNLALNARDAMPNGGKLIIETRSVVLDENYAGGHSDVPPGRYAMIAVSDTGTGIPASMHFFVFEGRALALHGVLLALTAVLAAVYPIWLVTTLPIATTLRNEVVS